MRFSQILSNGKPPGVTYRTIWYGTVAYHTPCTVGYLLWFQSTSFERLKLCESYHRCILVTLLPSAYTRLLVSQGKASGRGPSGRLRPSKSITPYDVVHRHEPATCGTARSVHTYSTVHTYTNSGYSGSLRYSGNRGDGGGIVSHTITKSSLYFVSV